MGIAKRFQGGRLAGQLAFGMIERCRIASVDHYGATGAEFGWVLEDNKGMVSIADLRSSRRNKVYRVYEKAL
jgi:hypothetical protein